jgi:hypothetical protein
MGLAVETTAMVAVAAGTGHRKVIISVYPMHTTMELLKRPFSSDKIKEETRRFLPHALSFVSGTTVQY